MIDLHYWTTPNGHKITIFLEETRLPYRIVPVNISKGEQFEPEFLISPRTIAFRPLSITTRRTVARRSRFSSSGAILVYLAEKTGKFLPAAFANVSGHGMAFLADGRARTDGGPKPSFLELRTREAPLRDRSLRQGDEPTIWRSRQTPVAA